VVACEYFIPASEGDRQELRLCMLGGSVRFGGGHEVLSQLSCRASTKEGQVGGGPHKRIGCVLTRGTQDTWAKLHRQAEF
jgi:hypothetical protein